LAEPIASALFRPDNPHAIVSFIPLLQQNCDSFGISDEQVKRDDQSGMVILIRVRTSSHWVTALLLEGTNSGLSGDGNGLGASRQRIDCGVFGKSAGEKAIYHR
jgi:hypothetical protein